jgi:hypothetical protein
MKAMFLTAAIVSLLSTPVAAIQPNNNGCFSLNVNGVISQERHGQMMEWIKERWGEVPVAVGISNNRSEETAVTLFMSPDGDWTIFEYKGHGMGMSCPIIWGVEWRNIEK